MYFYGYQSDLEWFKLWISPDKKKKEKKMHLEINHGYFSSNQKLEKWQFKLWKIILLVMNYRNVKTKTSTYIRI